MSVSAKAIPLSGLRRRAMSLGAAKAFDHATQFLLPIVLVRCLDTVTFGEYRLLWLAIATLMFLATFNMPGSLFVHLPRCRGRFAGRLRRLYVNQTLLFLAAAGLACAFLVSPWNPARPAAIEPLAAHGALVPSFVALWIAASLLDFLPTVDERVRWQALSSIALSVLRVLMLAAGAFLTGSMQVLLWLLLAFVLVKLAVLLAYIARYHGLGGPLARRRLLRAQVGRAAPIGVSNALYGLRWQADQWIVAQLFTLSSFAAFSIAGIFGQVVNVFRTSVNEAFLPSMSRLHAGGDARAMLELNSRANVMVGTLLFPILAFGFFFADEVVRVMYTAAYLEAVPVMRLYIVAFALMVIEVGSLVLLLNEGRFALKVNLAMLAYSAAASTAGALAFGLPGAALGGVTAIYLDRLVTLRRIARRTGVPITRVQDWAGLGLALLYGVVAVLFVLAVVNTWFDGRPPLVRLLVGGTVLTVIYAVAWLYLRKVRKPA